MSVFTDELVDEAAEKIEAGGPDYGAPEIIEGEGWRIIASVDPDEGYSIFDEQGAGVWCGRLEWDDSRGDSRRPDGFNGGAELLRFRDGNVWWQPEPDCLQDRQLRDAVRRQIRDAFEYGYSVLGVRVDVRATVSWPGGSRETWQEVGSAYLGGVMSAPDVGSWAELVSEAVADAGI
jgi:hypothetical protein